MRKRFIHTTFVIILSFPQFLFAGKALSVSSNKINGVYNYWDLSAVKNNSVNNYFHKGNLIPFVNFIYNSQPVTICSGAPIIIKGDIESPVPNSYIWQVLQGGTWVDAPGANTSPDYSASLLLNATNANIIFNIRRQITVGGVLSFDSFYDVTVLSTAPLSNNVITAPAVTRYCSGDTPGTITGSTPTGGIGGFIYQWQSSVDNVNFTDIAGANTIDYTPTQITSTTYYRRNIIGSCTIPLQSNSVVINIVAGVSNNIINAPAITSFCLSGDADPIIGQVPTGSDGVYTYQWQSSTDNLTFTDITGATQKDYDPANSAVTMYYRRFVTAGVCAVPVYSNVVTITVLLAVTNNTITAPAVASFCLIGSPAAITGNNPTGGNGSYTYQWQSSADNINFTDIPGAVSADYTPGVVNATTYYQRTAISGSCGTPNISNIVAINILPVPDVPVLSLSATTVCPGSTPAISITNQQAGVTYNWYDSATKNNLLYTGTAYAAPPITTSSIIYVESTNGACTGVSMATVQINASIPPDAPLVAANSVNSCNGVSATLSVSNVQPGFIYNWYQAATGGVPVFTGNNFTTPTLSANATYYVEAVNATGCTSANRTAINVIVSPADQITTQGASVCPGSAATISATTSDPNVTINWYANSTGGSPVFTGSTLTIPSLLSDVSYYVETTNSVTGCVSASRTLVQALISQQLPAPVVIVDATTNTSVSFKWAAVAGATGYKVSIDNGLTYTDPSSGANGLSHVVSGLQLNQAVTILVEALGINTCQLSSLSTAVTANAIDQKEDIYVANAFTPNGDGKNDLIYVHSESIKSLKFYVYDQWGEMLFSTTSIGSGWDGTFKGTKEPVGVYVYYLIAEMNNGREVSKKGTITLLR